jgi:Ni/Fe-hydrogenase 1 B-type cytochrome subunit
MQAEYATGRVLSGPYEDTYVYQALVRIWHWTTVLCFLPLVVTGYLIGSPPPAIGGEAVDSFMFGWIRTVHFSAAMVLAVAFMGRIYLAFSGNHHARTIFVPPLWSPTFWRGLVSDLRDYVFISKHEERWLGHNPLALMGMFFMFTLGTFVLIFTGLGLYAQGYGWGSLWMNAFGWVTVLLGTPQAVRTVHHFAMWYVMIFSIIHIYMVFRQDLMGRTTIVSTMISGIRMFKNEPKS